MTIHGSCLSHPIRADQRGTLAVVPDRSKIIEESIISIIETRQGERVMLPDYGIPDFVFSVMDAGFAARVAYFIEQQVLNYEPLVENVKVSVNQATGVKYEDPQYKFMSASIAEQHRAEIHIRYRERGSNSVFNLVYPLWQLRSGL